LELRQKVTVSDILGHAVVASLALTPSFDSYRVEKGGWESQPLRFQREERSALNNLTEGKVSSSYKQR